MSKILSSTQLAMIQEARRPRGYQAAREVTARASVTESNETPRNRKALDRLEQFMDAGKAPRDDVPRGFYLNIQV
ncbi:MAG: hypothetical protein ISR52_00115 [Rhodospirillales bacterium]|nr:hypothetical protein [Rhodospirillales bacterium]